jgi:hypothetical protein
MCHLNVIQSDLMARKRIVVIGFVSGAILVGAFVLAADKPGDSIEYGRIFPIVMYHETDAKDLRPFAEEVAKSLDPGRPPVVQASPRNPVCCVWLEITHWTPNPGKPGWIIINQGGGSIISASDTKQMKLAVEKFKSTARRVNDGTEAPLGL